MRTVDPATKLTHPRHHCRKCGTALATPQANPNAAFCCRGCFEQYHRRRCVVCGQEYERNSERERWLCGRKQCKTAWEAFPIFYRPFHPRSAEEGTITPKLRQSGVQTPEKRASIKPLAKSLRAFDWVALPEGDWELYRGGRRVAAIRRVDPGKAYRLVHPSICPAPPIEPLQAAKHRAECVALWTLPTSMPRQPAVLASKHAAEEMTRI